MAKKNSVGKVNSQGVQDLQTIVEFMDDNSVTDRQHSFGEAIAYAIASTAGQIRNVVASQEKEKNGPPSQPALQEATPNVNPS